MNVILDALKLASESPAGTATSTDPHESEIASLANVLATFPSPPDDIRQFTGWKLRQWLSSVPEDYLAKITEIFCKGKDFDSLAGATYLPPKK